MVKINAPALSLSASGTIADSITYANWKGRPYARLRVIPANPKSANQVGMRSMFKFLTQAWTNVSATNKATWSGRADDYNYSPFNAYLSANMNRWRQFKAPAQMDPASEDDTLPTLGSLTGSGGSNQATITQAVTAAGDGWAIVFFRSQSEGFQTNWNNAVGIVQIAGTQNVVFVDTPLAAGDYYFNARAITKAGKLGTEGTEVSVTVT